MRTAESTANWSMSDALAQEINSNSQLLMVSCNVTTRVGSVELEIWFLDISGSCSPARLQYSACRARWRCRRETDCAILVQASPLSERLRNSGNACPVSAFSKFKPEPICL